MPYLYMEASPQLKGKARQFGRQYRKMAVVEVEPGYGPDRIPKMISARARGVVRVVDCATLYVGKTGRSAGLVWRDRMLALCAALNAAESETLHGVSSHAAYWDRAAAQSASRRLLAGFDD